MGYGSPDIYTKVQRLDWNKIPQMNYYGKKQRGKRRDFDENSEEKNSSSSPRSGNLYDDESPFSKAASSLISSNIPSLPKDQVKEMKSLGIQAILLRSSHHKREDYEPSEDEESRK